MSNFAYMSGTGNDFIVSTYTGPTSEIQIISLVADSDYDVDGVIFVESIDDESVKMHYFNNDGTPAELCVNGVRCAAKYAVDNQLVDGTTLIVQAPVGNIEAFVDSDIVKIEAPIPTIGKEVEIDSFNCMTSDVGNPHLMVEVDDVENFDLNTFSEKARNIDLFKNGINIEIYSVVDQRFIYARVNERGVGETDACGSGALALFSFLRSNNKVQDEAVVLYPGGELDMSFEDGKMYLKGSVTYL